MADDAEQKTKNELQYRQLGEIDVGDKGTLSHAKVACKLLTVANIYGYVFVGTSTGFKVYISAAVLSAGKNEDGEIKDLICDVTLRNAPHWLGISADNLSLVVCSSGERGLQMLFFDTRCLINKLKPTKTPFCSITLAKEADVLVSGMQWNPSTEFAHLLAICLGNGSFFILSITDSIKEIGQRPKEFGASAVCWSPKGKQIIVGKKDGVLLQLTPKLEVRRTVEVCPNIDIHVEVCNVMWLSTYQFAVAYVRADDLNSAPNLFLAHVPAKNETRETLWSSYEDPCYSSSEDCVSRYYLPFLENWEIFAIFSSNSSESAVMGKNRSTNKWEVWSLDDDANAILPIGKDNEDTSPYAASFITTDTDDILIDVATERSCGPMPVLVILTNEGRLLLFQFINQMNGYVSHTAPPNVLSVEGERNAIGNRGSSLSGENGNLPAKTTNLLKQKILMKPNIMSTSTPIASKFKNDLQGTMTPITSAANSLFAVQASTGVGESFIQAQTPSKPPPTLAGNVGITQKPPLHPSFATKPGNLSMGTSLAPFSNPSTDDNSFSLSSNGNKHAPTSAMLHPPPKVVHVAQSAPKLIQERSKPPPAYRSTPANTDTTEKHKVKKLQQDGGLMSRELMEVIGSFEKELSLFQHTVKNESIPTLIEDCLGSNEDRSKIKNDVIDLTTFKKEVVRNTKEQHTEINDLRGSIAESLNAIQSAEMDELRQRSESYKALLYDRPLNMNDQKKVKNIKEVYQYLRQNVREADSSLDMQWEKSQSRGQTGRKMKGGQWQVAYQALINNTKIRHELEIKITVLSQTLEKLRLAKASSLLDRRHGIKNQQLYSPMEFSPAPNRSSNLQRLADEMLLKDGNKQTPESSRNFNDKSRKTSAKKMAQLAHALSARKTTPIRKFAAVPKRLSRNSDPSDVSPIGFISNDSPVFRARSATPRTNTPISEQATSTSEETTPTSEEVPSPLPEQVKPSQSSYFTQGVQPSPSNVASHFVSNAFGFGKVETSRNAPSPSLQFTTHKPIDVPVKPEIDSKPGFSFPTSLQAQGITALPQGSATLGYGAPEYTVGKTTQIRPKFTEKLSEAASNLNNPPKVVNVKDMNSEPGAFESHIPPLPQKFQPQGNVPDGAAAVIQTVLNTVNAEQMKKHVSPFSAVAADKPSFTSSAPAVTATITSLILDLDNTAAPLATSINNSTVTNKLSGFGGFSYGEKGKEPTSTVFGGKPVFGRNASPSLFGGGLVKSASIGGFGALASKPSTNSNNKPGFFTSASDKSIPSVIGNSKVLATAQPTTPFKQIAPLLATSAPDKKEKLTEPGQPSTQSPFTSSVENKPAFVAASQPSTPLTPEPEVSTTTFLSTQSATVTSNVTAIKAATPSAASATVITTPPVNIFAASNESSVFGAQFGKTSTVGNVFGSSSGFGFGMTSQPTIGDNNKAFGSSTSLSTSTEGTSTSTAGLALTTQSTAQATELSATLNTVTVSSANTISGALPTSTTAGVTSGFELSPASTTTSESVVVSASTASTTTAVEAPTTTSTGFGTLPATTASAAGGFGTLPASTAGGFGAFAASTEPTAIGFGASTVSTAPATGFGALAAPTEVSTATGFGSLAESTAPSATGFGALASSSSTSAFGVSTATTGFEGFAATSASTGFGSLSGTAFGVTSTQSTFGSSSFGQPSAFGSSQPSSVFVESPKFGQQPSVFGETKQPQPAFGATAVSTQSSGFGFGSGGGGGGFLSGLGGSAPKFGESKNPFAANVTVEQPPGNSSIFGSSSSNRAFGGGFGQQQTASAFGSSGGGSQFGSGGANVAEQGFGAFNKPAQPVAAGFSSAPSFGGTPAFGAAAKFGSPPAFGTQSAFGASSGFGNTSFGATTQQPTGAFAGFANTQTSGFGSFGGGNNANSSFGASNDQSKGPSFSGWR